MKTREIHLTQNFTGPVKPDYFKVEEVDLREPEDGEVQVVNEWLSVDPYMRGRMIGIKTYVDPFQPGAPMEGRFGCASSQVFDGVGALMDLLEEGDEVPVGLVGRLGEQDRLLVIQGGGDHVRVRLVRHVWRDGW